MKSKSLSRVLFVAMIGTSFCGAYLNASPDEAQEAAEMMSGLDAEQRAAASARAKDAAWKPSCTEVGLIRVGEKNSPGALKNFCLDAQGNLLTCYAPANGKPAVRVYSPKGELLKTLPLEFKPGAICAGKDGSMFVAGEGQLQKLDPAGKVLATASSPVANEVVTISKETEEMIKEMATQTKRPFQEEMARMKENLERRRGEVTGLASTEQDVFMAVPSPNDFTFRVYRFSQALQEPKLVVQKLRGCCGQMDIQAHNGKLWVAHNARHSVQSMDRDGNELSKFGKAGRVKASDFGGCCEPKNVRVLPDGDILAAESGPPTCIKRFSATGQFKEVIGVVPDSKGDCVRVTVATSPDGRQYYMLDTARDAIRVFGSKT
jgi:hypothetical protein